MVFYPEIAELDSYTDWETDLALHHARQNAHLNGRKLPITNFPAKNVDVTWSDLESEGTGPEPDGGHTPCKKRGFWTTLNHEYELDQHKTENKLYDKRDNDNRNREMSHATAYLLKTGQHAHTFDNDSTDDLISRENLTRAERHQIRKAKSDKMRTDRVDETDDPKVRLKFIKLRLDQPLWNLQPKACWEREQANLKHERSKQENEARIRQKALDFQYNLRMSLTPKESPECGDQKSCFSTCSKVECASKKVRFDDVHEATKVRWVDVEHTAELAQPQHHEFCNAF